MTEPNFRDLATKALYYLDRMPLASSYPLAREIRAALATSPPEPPEQKSSIDELIAGCKPLDPEMAEALTTEARCRLFGEDNRDDLPPHIRAKMESDELWAAFWLGRSNEIENT